MKAVRLHLAAALLALLALAAADVRAQVTGAVPAEQAGNGRIAPGIALTTLSGWTSGTSVNATQNIFTNSGTGAVLLHLVQGTTISAGAITFEVSYDNTNWVTIPADSVLDPASTTFAQISLPYTLVASTNKPFLLMGKGWQGLRIKLSTAITGSATVTPNYALLSNEPLKSVLALSPSAANLNSNVSQATAANLNARADTSGATGAAPPARADFVGGITSGATGGFITGIPVCDSFANVNISTATTTLIVTGVSGRHVRICSAWLITAAANNVALISGTGATCGTGTTGMTGGTTSAAGLNFAANGGIAGGAGIGTINQTNATGDSVCIITSAGTQLSGRIAYTIY